MELEEREKAEKKKRGPKNTTTVSFKSISHSRKRATWWLRPTELSLPWPLNLDCNDFYVAAHGISPNNLLLLSRSRNGSRRQPQTVADAGKSSSCEAELKATEYSARGRQPAPVSLVLVSVFVWQAVITYCVKSWWTDLVVLGSRKCSISSLPCHLPWHCSCAGLVFWFASSFFTST